MADQDQYFTKYTPAPAQAPSGVGNFFSQLGSGFVSARNPAWGEQQIQRQQMAELLKQRLFSENQATQKMDLEQKEFQSNDAYRKWQMGQHPDGTPMSPEEMAGQTSPAARSRTTRTGGTSGTPSALNSPNEISAQEQFKLYNEGGGAVAPMTDQPINVTRGGSTTTLPWEQPFIPEGAPNVPAAGGGVFTAGGPASIATVKSDEAYATEAAKKRAENDAKTEAWNGVAGTPEMESLKYSNPTAYNDYKLEAQLGIKPQRPESSDAVRAHALNALLDAQTRGDKDGVDNWEKFLSTHFAKEAGAGLPENPEDIKTMAKGIANYQLPPLTGFVLRSNQGQAIMSQVLRENPDYQATNYNSFNRMETAASVGKFADSNNAMNTTLGHLKMLSDAGKALNSGDLQTLNTIKARYGILTGGDAGTVYNAIVNRVGPEITRAYIGAGAGTLEDRKGNKIDFDIAQSPKQRESNIQASIELLASKIKANQDQYNQGTYGRGRKKMLTQESEDFLKERGVNPTAPLTGSISGGNNKTSSTSKTQTAGEAFEAKLPRDRVVTVRGQKYRVGTVHPDGSWDPDPSYKP